MTGYEVIEKLWERYGMEYDEDPGIDVFSNGGDNWVVDLRNEDLDEWETVYEGSLKSIVEYLKRYYFTDKIEKKVKK